MKLVWGYLLLSVACILVLSMTIYLSVTLSKKTLVSKSIASKMTRLHLLNHVYIPVSVVTENSRDIDLILSVISRQEKLPYEIIVITQSNLRLKSTFGLCRIRAVKERTSLFSFYPQVKFDDLLFTKTYIQLVNSTDTIPGVEVPNVVFVCWTGENPITKRRKELLQSLKSKLEIPIVMVDTNNLSSFVLYDHPLHAGYQYLTPIIKSDYLRCYFMHHYGGGYSDIKAATGSWLQGLHEIQNNPTIYLMGVPEIGEHGVPVACGKAVQRLWKKLVCNGAFICRAQTPFTLKWYSRLLQVMDNKLEQLILHPPKDIRDYKGKKLSDGSISQYPIEWGELMGYIFQKVQAEHLLHVRNTLPTLDWSIPWLLDDN